MKKIVNYALVYILWIVDIGLALWLAIISRTGLLNIFGLSYTPGNLQYAYRAIFIDRIFSITLGLGWLAFVIFTEQYFRSGVNNWKLPERFARVTGSVLLGIFVVDLILFWLQGIGSGNWQRWLILAIELGLGTALVILARTRFASKSS